jgi:hypothetical protein
MIKNKLDNTKMEIITVNTDTEEIAESVSAEI